MTDVYFHEPQARPRWYRRRGAQAAVAGGVTAVLAITGLGISSAASSPIDPAQAVREASASLDELPSSITIDGGTGHPGEFTIVRTDSGARISVDAAEQGVAFDVAVVNERLFLRLASDQLDQFSSNPMFALAMSQYPSVGALLNGEWVSLDVSQDSPTLASLRELTGGQVADDQAVADAAKELQSSLEAVAEDLRGPLTDSLRTNVNVAAVDDATGPQGSDHYQVTIDAQAVKSDLEPAIRDALDQALAAVDTFVTEVGTQVPGAAAQWETKRAEIVASVDQALSDTAPTAEPIDVWIADGTFTQISVKGATLTFDQTPSLDVPETAVSMDADIARLLPMLQNLGGVEQLRSLVG